MCCLGLGTVSTTGASSPGRKETKGIISSDSLGGWESQASDDRSLGNLRALDGRTRAGRKKIPQAGVTEPQRQEENHRAGCTGGISNENMDFHAAQSSELGGEKPIAQD